MKQTKNYNSVQWSSLKLGLSDNECLKLMDATSAGKHSIRNIIGNDSGGNGEQDGVDVVENSAAKTNNKNNANKPLATAVGRNPSILLALDSVHRSLLLKNLQFDREPSVEDDASDFVLSGGVSCRSEKKDPLEPRKSSEVVQITDAGVVDHHIPSKTQNIELDEVDGGCIEDLVKVCRDRNNNETSRVMMMVAKFDSAKGGGKMPVDETETSDFDTASVSSSSLGSVRSSSAFSEGSRDAASVGSYGSERTKPDVIGTGESHVVTAGSATITINIINKTAENCDNNGPLRASPKMKAVHVQVPDNESEAEHRTGASGHRAFAEYGEDEEVQKQFMLDKAAELFSDHSHCESAHFQTAESQEFLDCNDFQDSSTCEYDESSDETERNEEAEEAGQEEEEEDAGIFPKQSPKVINQELIDDKDEPMINIIQEMTRDMQVTSTVILNKAKIQELRKSRSAEKKEKQKNEKKKLENSHLSRQKIIDDNFCNEILDSTIHFDRLYGIKHRNAVEAPVEVLSDSALHPSSAGDESFDSSMSFGKLEGKPRYSGRPIGKLMARRLKKLEKQNNCKSDGNSDSSASNYANGPKKPPRTFASAKSQQSKIGWAFGSGSSTEAGPGKPSCPKLQELDSDPDLIGWKLDKSKKTDKRDKSHNNGFLVPKERANKSTIPSNIYNMLHYSEDEDRRRLIKTSNSPAAPQASCWHRVVTTDVGPKLDIDTVDFVPETPRRKSSSNLDFEQFVANSRIKSTPHKRAQCPDIGRRTRLFLDSERGENRQHPSKERRRRTTGDLLEAESRHFLGDSRRSDHEPDKPDESEICQKCYEKSNKQSFRKAAVRRTKSFFEASKKKIHLQTFKKNKHKPRYETPQKSRLGSNLNKTNSIKKQLHKHLGFTPDHLRCGSCPKESPMVRNNLSQTYSAPARITAEKRPKLPARTVLNFSGPELSVEDDNRKRQKPHEMKFLKTLKNLRISPKKFFKTNDDPKPAPMDSSSPRQHGNFQSYDDLNLDDVAQMGDFLNNVRQAVESERINFSERKRDRCDKARYEKSSSRSRHISTSSEFLDHPELRQIHVAADLHREPIYQEISPKNNKTIINEFISGESNHRYLMVNNNPNVIYATVNKTAKNLIKTKSINSICEEPQLQPPISLKKVNASQSTSPPMRLNNSFESHLHRSTGAKSRRSLFNTSGFDDEKKNSTLHEVRDVEDSMANVTAQQEVFEDVIVPRSVGKAAMNNTSGKDSNDAGDEDVYQSCRKDIQRTNGGTQTRGGLTSEELLLKTAVHGYGETTQSGRAPLGSIDTDDEIESLQKYQDGGLDDLLVTLRENIAISELDTIDTDSDAFVTGYDTVDFLINEGETIQPEANSSERLNSTINTEDISSELMSAQNSSVSNLSPVNSSPSSEKMRLNGSDIYRSLKDRLRSSFRKSKRFIKNEQRKIANLFDEKPPITKRDDGNRVAFDLDEYRRKYDSDTDADEIYQSLSNPGSLRELSNQYLSELVNQIKTQTDLKKQLKQALAVCRNTREFECSSELIEAERLMLLSTLKETAARNELSKIDYNSNGPLLNDSQKIGVVALNHFEFPLKETAMNDMLSNYFYLIVCSYKNQVKATLSKERHEDRVYFRNSEIKFHNLDADYEIRVEVFVLRLRKNARNYSFESKYHLNKDNKNLLDSLPRPSKLLSSRSSSPKSFEFDNEFSRFKSQGFLTLTALNLLPSNNHGQLLENRHQSPYYSASSNFQQMVRKQGDQNIFLVEDFKYFKLDSVVYNSNLLGGLGMSLKSEVLFINSEVTGFLTVGNIRGEVIDWSRKWCKMNGFVLEFWNYPQECQEKLPTLQIDLTKCTNDEIKLADRSVCSRKRTIQVEIYSKGTTSCSSSGISSYKDSDSHQHSANRISGSDQQQPQQEPMQQSPRSSSRSQQSENIRSFLLSVDTSSELNMWLNELNRVVKFLKDWKI